jgi:hypothetical protein
MTVNVTKLGIALLLCLALAGCTRVIDTPRPKAQPPAAPITVGQVSDLLSEQAQPDDDPNLFVTAEPEECAGLVREVDPPFLFDTTPAAHDGGQHFAEDGELSVSVVEMVAVYPASFDPKAAVDEAKRTIESCRNDTMFVTAMEGQELYFRLLPPSDSGSPDMVLWSVESGGWACDNAYVAAHNAAIELTTCGEVNGYDVRSLAEAALERIEKLANMSL